MKQTITKIYRSFQDKQGNSLKTKDGRNFERVAIKTQEYGDRYISGFGGDWNENWKIGDIIDIKIEQKGEYLNFSKIDRLDRLDELEMRIDELEARMVAYEMRGSEIKNLNYNKDMIEQDKLNNPKYENQEEIDSESLPF